MEAYYQDSHTTIYHGDCREILPHLDPVDLVLTDPPYGLGAEMWGSGTSIKENKNTWKLHQSGMAWDNEVLDPEIYINHAPMAIVWGGHLFSLPTARGWLVWNKIIRNFTSGVCELAWTNLNAPIDAFDYSQGQLATEGKKHPTQKPLPLMQWCIEKSKTTGTVLDPFMGSGTTLVAAKNLGRKAIGIELEEKYCEIAAKRLSQEVLPLGATNAAG